MYGRLTLDGVRTSYRRRANARLVMAVFWCVAGLTWTSYARRMDGVRTLSMRPQWTERNAEYKSVWVLETIVEKTS